MIDVAKTWLAASSALAVTWWANAEVILSCVLLFLSIFYTCLKLWKLWQDEGK